MKHKHEKSESVEEGSSYALGSKEKGDHEQYALLMMDLEKMLDAINRDLAESLPTIAAAELRPQLLRALALARLLDENSDKLDDSEKLAAGEELNMLRRTILEKYPDWKDESIDALSDAIDGTRKQTFGTMIIPPDWNDPNRPLQ